MIRSGLRFSLVVMVLIASASQASAVRPDEVMKDPALEAKAREISAELRCLVCQNQSIDDSDAPLARDLRLLVRERLKAGDGEEDVIDFVVARYGEFVLLRPRFTPNTYLLWFAPFLLLLTGGYLAYRLFGRRHGPAPQTPDPLTAQEEAQLNRILEEKRN